MTALSGGGRAVLILLPLPTTLGRNAGWAFSECGAGEFKGGLSVAKRKTEKDAAAEEAVAAEEQVEEQVEGAEAAAADDAGADPAAQIQQQITIDDSSVDAEYANFCRVSSTPEELILDLGLTLGLALEKVNAFVPPSPEFAI